MTQTITTNIKNIKISTAKVLSTILLVGAFQNNYCLELKTAKLLAKAQNKEILYFIVDDGCNWCRKLFDEISNSTELKQIINANFIVVVRDKNNIDLNMPYFELTPTIVRLNSRGKANLYIEGYVPKEQLKLFLKGVEN